MHICGTKTLGAARHLTGRRLYIYWLGTITYLFRPFPKLALGPWWRFVQIAAIFSLIHGLFGTGHKHPEQGWSLWFIALRTSNSGLSVTSQLHKMLG
jgi:hypothetical protein